MGKEVRAVGMLRSRRGTAALEDSLFYLFDLLILVIAGAVLFKVAHDLTANPLIEQRYVATEVALLLDAVQAAPGNIAVRYSANLPLTVAIAHDAGNYVAVHAQRPGEESEISNPTTYPFHVDRFLKTEYRKFNVDTGIMMVKEDGKLVISERPIALSAGLPMPTVDTYRQARKIITIPTDDRSREMLQYLIEGSMVEGSLSDLQSLIRDADLVILARSAEREMPLLFVPDNPESLKLANLMLRELPQRNGAVVQISESYLEPGDLRNLLRGNIGVEVVLPADAEQATGTALNRAVNAYFEKSFTLPKGETIDWQTEVIGDARVIIIP